MLSNEDRAALLERALTSAVAESRGWRRRTGGGGWWIEASSPTAADGRRLEVDLRPDGDVDVRFHVRPSAASRGPYEAHCPVPDGREAETLEAVARFVAELVDERIVLALRRGWLRGGREFIAPAELTPARRRHLDWVVSWRGTYDWVNPE